MEKEILNVLNNSELPKAHSLYDNINKLDDSEYLVILDFYHTNSDIANESEFIAKHLQTVKEVCYLDTNVIYLIFTKPWVLEGEKDLKTKNSIMQLIYENDNIFIEDKLSNIHFLVGFGIAKKSTVYMFTEETTKNSNWLKLKDVDYQNRIKSSDFEFMKVTMEYMLREKKRNYEQRYGKKPSKLAMILNNDKDKERDKNKDRDKNRDRDRVDTTTNTNTYISSNPNASNSKWKISNVKNLSLNDKESEIINSNKFHQIIESVRHYFINSPPKNFTVIKNIISNFSEQNVNYFLKNNSNFKIDSDILSFLLLKDLLDKEIVINNILHKLIEDKVINTITDIDNVMNFYLNLGNTENDGRSENKQAKEGTQNKIKNKNRKKHKNESCPDVAFSISETAEEEYNKLILSCPPISNYVKKTVIKILSNFCFNNIDKLPTNPAKYKNYIFSFINNQELLKISKKILNMDYDRILNILTDGVIIELMRNNLVVFLSDKKIHYNIYEIEAEKFRLSQS